MRASACSQNIVLEQHSYQDVVGENASPKLGKKQEGTSESSARDSVHGNSRGLPDPETAVEQPGGEQPVCTGAGRPWTEVTRRDSPANSSSICIGCKESPLAAQSPGPNSKRTLNKGKAKSCTK